MYNEGWVWDDSSIAIDINGCPHISYYDSLNFNLKYAKWQDRNDKLISYEWDFDVSDSLWWETGPLPDATGPNPTHIYGDDGIYVTTLKVTNNDGLSTVDTCNITVLNVKTVSYLNNPPNSGPYPSPEVNPVDIMDTITFVYEAPGTVILVVKDDNGGVGTAILDIS